jgi:hypothetical protein
MRACLLSAILGLALLTGCVPDFVSVSRDGTIALTLHEDGEFEPLEGEDQHIYLTNANADFLTKVERLEGCGYPQISPSGRFIVALSEDGLVLYDRETKRRRVIYRQPEGADDWSVNFPVWSPDEKEVAFFAGDFEDDPPKCRLNVYDVRRRELQVLARRACPRAAWWPDSKHLLYISFPPGASEGGGEPPFGDLKVVHVRTAEERTLARRQLFSYSRVAVFAGGNAILYPCVRWDKTEITPAGVTAPLVLKKDVIPGLKDKTEERPSDKEEKAEPPQPEQAEAKPDVEKAEPAAGQEKAQEKSFVLEEGQPFHPYICAVSPDGKKIAYARSVWAAPGSGDAEERDTEPERWEICVANADGTNGVAVARASDEGFFQVLWVSDTRLICVSSDGEILAVDADGKNKLNLIEAIATKFADQFEQVKEEEEKEEAEETTQGST